WHISLSTWFRDFVYIPLGGNQVSRGRQVLNLMATFMLSGLWHGANWTFLVWGFLHGLYCVPRVFIGEPLARFAEARLLAVRVSFVLLSVGLTFARTLVAWIFFRAADIGTAFRLIHRLFSASLFGSPVGLLRSAGILSPALYGVLGICFMLTLEWL